MFTKVLSPLSDSLLVYSPSIVSHMVNRDEHMADGLTFMPVLGYGRFIFIFFILCYSPSTPQWELLEHNKPHHILHNRKFEKFQQLCWKWHHKHPLCPNPLNLPQATSMKCPVAYTNLEKWAQINKVENIHTFLGQGHRWCQRWPQRQLRGGCPQ